MQIMPINALSVKTTPSFTSRHRVGQDDTYKLYKNEGSSDGSIPSLAKAFLYQRFNFNERKRGEVEAQFKTYDSFTGLRDKNYLLASLDAAMQNAQDDDKVLSIAMLDMDDFKSVNELLGYETGDLFIKEISRDIEDIAKENNIAVYRFGGEEFILIFDDLPNSKKEKIAKAITEKTNTNEVLQSYKNMYSRRAQSRLDRALYSTSKVHRISDLVTKRETLEEVMNSLSSPEAKNDPYFSDEIDKIDQQTELIYQNLVNECLQKEKNEDNIAMLRAIKEKMMSGEGLSKSEQRTLDEYLFFVYDKSNEIYQTRKWMSDFKTNDGFGITCGIVNFEPGSLELETPMDIIAKAGKVLKKGKAQEKGQVYLENIKM